jgi:peptidoglycan hydrolase-like protein with peptidoglycan-binding domain
MTKAESHFRAVAPQFMQRFMDAFLADLLSTSAAFGNLGLESNGLTTLQEISPTVKGSRGGYGWAQWTGPRRRNYESFCRVRKLDPASDEANYQFLVSELSGSYKSVLPKVKAASGLKNKVIAFERGYEGAGVKNYDARMAWANIAYDAFSGGAVDPTLPMLWKGARGAAVQTLQKMLGVPADGVFGQITKEAVVAYQRGHGLVPDGVVGPVTWAALGR